MHLKLAMAKAENKGIIFILTCDADVYLCNPEGIGLI